MWRVNETLMRSVVSLASFVEEVARHDELERSAMTALEALAGALEDLDHAEKAELAAVARQMHADAIRDPTAGDAHRRFLAEFPVAFGLVASEEDS